MGGVVDDVDPLTAVVFGSVVVLTADVGVALLLSVLAHDAAITTDNEIAAVTCIFI